MNSESKDEIIYIYLDDIIPNRFQPREVFDEKALKELAISIKEHGVIQPIIVRSVNGKYEIIAGERRYKASALAGMTKIPAIVRNLDDKESSKVALLENLQRKNLNPIEEARTYQKILEIDQMTQDELAKTMGKSQSAVANKLRLLSLSDEIQESLLKEQISERHARALLTIPDEGQQKKLLKNVINNKLSVRALEEEISSLLPKGQRGDNMQQNNNINTITTSFINTVPLSPDVVINDEQDEIGKVKIAPPEGTTIGMNNKFINYEETENESQSNKFIQKSENNGNLDSLLNLNQVSQKSSSPINKQNFITPAEAIVKESIKQEEEGEKDYFAMPDFNSMNMNCNVSLENINNQELSSPSKENYTIDSSIRKIGGLVEEIRNHGIKISFNEMDFQKSHQIIIKIDKE